MHHRLTVTLVALIAGLAIAPASLAASGPTITGLRINQDPSGSAKGNVTVIAHVDLRGFVRKADLPTADKHPLVRGRITLTDASGSVQATDTVALHPLALKGYDVRLDFRIPAARARALGDAARVHVALAVTLNGRTATVLGKQRSKSRSTRQFFGSCVIAFFCPVYPTPSPAATVGFTYANGGSICLAFNGNGYASPALYNITLWDAAGDGLMSSDDPAVAADGTFTDSWWEQPANGSATQAASITGSVPIALLSGPASASTPPITATYPGPQFGGFASPLSMPYSASVATNSC